MNYQSSPELGVLMSLCAKYKEKTLPECLRLLYEAKEIYIQKDGEAITTAIDERGKEVTIEKL